MLNEETNEPDKASEKKIDESWKQRIKQQNEDAEGSKMPEMPEASFPVFISGLGMQALAALGEIENPLTKKKEANLNEARYLIDIIEMLQKKTKGNTTNEEKDMLENLLYQLRMLYLEKAKPQI